MTAVLKKIVVDEHGKPREVIIPWSQFCKIAEALGLERELQQLLFTSEDAKEGLKAYGEKRAAQFKGR